MILKLKLKNLVRRCFEGDLTMSKVMLWLICTVCMLAGIVYGLCMAPFTHGISIGSNNRNYDRCFWSPEEEEECEA